MKTLEEWRASGLSFDEYFKKGDEIDEDTYFYFLEELPPAAMSARGFLVGEAARTVGGVKLYSAFAHTVHRKYYYEGEMTSLELQLLTNKIKEAGN